MSMRSGSRAVSAIRFTSLIIAFLVTSLTVGILGAGLVVPAVGALGLMAKTGTEVFQELPSDFEMLPPSQQSQILDKDGNTLARFYAENRTVVPLDQISEHMQKAIVAIEDHRFYEHKGVDPQGLMRALVSNVSSNKTQGASTLTQQLVKNTLIEAGVQKDDRAAINAAKAPNLGRKLREAKYALALEKKLTKPEILEGYLNIAPFGACVYGAEAASQYFFSIPAADMSLAQSALLAGLAQSPVKYDPTRNPEAAEKRRNQVLKAMLTTKVIDQEAYDENIAIPVADLLNVSTIPQGCATAGNAGYFCNYVVREIRNSPEFGPDDTSRRTLLLRGGLKIHTTLDREKQDQAWNAVTDHVPVNDPSNVKMALASIEPGTGYIQALAQNTNFGNPTEDDPSATQTSFTVDVAHGGTIGFQPGSSFKTITLATWFSEGRSAYDVLGGVYYYDQNSWITSCPDALGSSFPFQNANGTGDGPTTVMEGTIWSINSTYFAMANQMDLCKIRNMAIALGAVPGKGDPGTFVPSDVLGSWSVPPLHMANAYATLAAHGTYCNPIAITQVTDSIGTELPVPKANCRSVISAETADKTTLLLEATAHNWNASNIGRPIAVKSGTTNEAKAAWLVGYTPNLATAVWAGHSEGGVPMMNVVVNGQYYAYVYGVLLPIHAWRDYMYAATSDLPVEYFNPADIGRPPPPPKEEPTETPAETPNP